jgi:hypothetical protein
MRQHWLIREKHEAKRNRWFSCDANFLIFCLDTKETKNQEATSRSGKISLRAKNSIHLASAGTPKFSKI